MDETGNYPGEIIALDLCAEFQVSRITLGGHFYYAIFKDLFTNYTKIIFLRQRRDIIDELEWRI